MQLSKQSRRTILKSIEDALYQIEKLNQGFLKQADGTRLDVIQLCLEKIRGKVVKHGKRRSG